ncbi:sugar transferase, partial [Schumannella luteola]
MARRGLDLPRHGTPLTMDDARRWRLSYTRRLAWSDLLVVAGAVAGAQLLWFGVDSRQLDVPEELTAFAVNYTLFSLALIGAWAIALTVAATREPRIVGAGSDEYRRVTSATLQLFGVVAIAGFALQVQVSRGYLLVALPVGLLALLVERWAWRRWLHSVRRTGGYSARCVVLGGSEEVRNIVVTLRQQTDAGYRPVAACTSDPRRLDGLGDGIRVAPIEELASVMAETGADTVVVVSGHGLSAPQLRELSWSLVPGDQHLVVVPNLVDVAGPRIHARPVAGLPLVHVETPRYRGASRFTKRAFDVLGALLAVVVLSPVLLATVVAVRVTSPGPVLFTQTRIGKDGEPFRMHKFRSMRLGADAELAELLEAQGTAET